MSANSEDQCNPLVLAVLRQRIMPDWKKKLAGWQADLAKASIGEFSDAANGLIAGAMTCLAIKFGVNDIEIFGKATLRKVFEWIVGELNSALPTDHPYIISILHIGNDPGTALVVLDRKTLPGSRDFVDAWKIPFAWAPTKECAESGRYQVKKILSPDGETIVS